MRPARAAVGLLGAALAICAAARAACADSDAACHSLEATALTNEVRARHGQAAPLRDGPRAMLDNALSHSRAMAATGTFEHQDLAKVTDELQCGLFCSGENIAMSSPQSPRSPAQVCVDLWENSPGHLKNILSNEHLVSVGIAFAPSASFYCTQTFANPPDAPGPDVTSGRCGPMAAAATNGSRHASMAQCMAQCMPGE